MFIDFILFLSVTVTILKFAMRHLISAELSAEFLIGLVVLVAFLRIFGSTALRKKAQVSKTIGSLVLFALDIAQRDIMVTLLIAVVVILVAVMLFGIYYMFSELFLTTRR